MQTKSEYYRVGMAKLPMSEAQCTYFIFSSQYNYITCGIVFGNRQQHMRMSWQH